jgi:hypothetical protein
VEFSPEEMAEDCPRDVSDPKKFPTIRPNNREWKKFLDFRHGFARLDPELRKVFKNDKAVNDALKELLRIKRSIDLTLGAKKRKSA